MPEINVEFRETLPPFEEGDTLEIVSAEIVTTMIRGFRGVRVIAKDLKTGQFKAEMLWLRDVVGDYSKLGAFIKALGKNTDNWIGKKIKIVRWQPKNRKIQVIG